MTSHYSFGCRGGFKAWARDKRPPRQRVRSSRLHVEVAAWADTYAALFANFALTPNCVCHVQPVRAEQPSEFGALARQGRVTGYPSDNHRITIFLSGLFLCFLNVGDRENASAVRAFGCGV